MKTVRVRIAVAVNSDGEWYAKSGSKYEEEVMAMDAMDSINNPSITYFVEADIPVPEAQVIEGRVCE